MQKLPPLVLTYRPPGNLIRVLFAAHFFTLAPVLFTDIGVLWQLAGLLALAASFIRARAILLPAFPVRVDAISVRNSQDVVLSFADGRRQSAVLSSDSVISHWLLTAVFRTLDGSSHVLVFSNGNLDSESFRRLRVRLLL